MSISDYVITVSTNMALWMELVFENMNGTLAQNDTSSNWTIGTQVIVRFYVYCIVMLPIGLLGIIGNTTSFFVLYYQHRRHLAANRFIMLKALAVADTFYLMTTIFMLCGDAIMKFNRVFVFYDSYILVQPALYGLNNVAMSIATWILIGVSAERSIAVTRPFQARQLLIRRNIYFVIVIICVFSLLLNLPRFFEQYIGLEYDTEMSHDRKVTTIITRSFFYNEIYMFLYNCALMNIINIIAPLIVLIYYNIKLMQEIRQSRRMQQLNPANLRTGSDLRLTKMVVAIITVFILCHLPNFLMMFMYIAYAVENRTSYKFMTQILSVRADLYIIYSMYLAKVINSSINFTIYYITNLSFRKTFCGMFCRCLKKYTNLDEELIFTLDTGNTQSLTECRYNTETISIELSSENSHPMECTGMREQWNSQSWCSSV
jgi:hypothetical protein